MELERETGKTDQGLSDNFQTVTAEQSRKEGILQLHVQSQVGPVSQDFSQTRKDLSFCLCFKSHCNSSATSPQYYYFCLTMIVFNLFIVSCLERGRKRQTVVTQVCSPFPRLIAGPPRTQAFRVNGIQKAESDKLGGVPPSSCASEKGSYLINIRRLYAFR